jgi:heterotetrameric sarcosine oxidase delta subunit
MMIIPCVHCGPRNASEFQYRGETGSRPDPNRTTPVEWHSYLYDESNAAGWVTERWYHTAGCRRFFVIERHTVTHEIRAARPPDRAPGASE